ncbi:MAG: hypothetical protein WC374_02440 [Phycisphaerae bacterium]|jgi:hypothetical protein
MANEIHIDYQSGCSVYACVRNSAGDIWNPSSQEFENYGSDGHTAADYAIALADKGGNHYAGDFDTAINAGRYTIQIFVQNLSLPADTDALIGTGCIVWTGVAELTGEKILANKAVQNKLTGAIEYYDDDAQTVILTITPSEDETTLTRTPS